MLRSVSWQQYFNAFATLVIIYYFLIWIILFKARVPSLASLRQISLRRLAGRGDTGIVVKHITEELQPVFVAGLDKNELTSVLLEHLKKYSDNEAAGFRISINEFICRQSEKICGIRLSEEDLRVLWIRPDEQPLT